MKKRLTILLIPIICCSATGQTYLIDSLKIRVAQKELHDTLRVDGYTQLGDELLFNERLEEAKKYGEKAKELASSIGYNKGVLNAMNVLASYSSDIGEYKKAVSVFEEYISLCEEISDTTGIRTGNNNLGLSYHDQGKYDKSLKHYLIALNLAELQKDYTGISLYYNNISMTYYANNQYEKAIEYTEKALKIEREHGASPKKIIIRSINLSSYYNDFGKTDQAVALLEEIIVFNDTTIRHELFGAYLQANLGNAYLHLKEYSKAIAWSKKAYPVFEKTSYNQLAGKMDLNIAQAYTNLDQPKKALYHIEKGLKIAEESKEPEFKRYAFEVAAEVFKNRNDYQRALDYTHRLFALKDSLLNNEKTNAIIEMQTKYETAEKERRLDEQEKELIISKLQKENQQWVLIGTLFVLFLIIIFAIVIFNRLKITRKQKLLIEERNEENELLLGEIHHRVKNNLQMISSLLNLQQRGIEDEKAKKAVIESRDRVKSMALLHKMLYQNDKFSAVNISEFTDTLSKELCEIHDVKIERKLSVIDLMLDVETAVPIALILNELIINSVKYAFVNIENPIIDIAINEKDGILYLEYADNGVGISNIENLHHTGSFGSKLISFLTRQLKGELEISSVNGTHYKFVFKKYIVLNA